MSDIIFFTSDDEIVTLPVSIENDDVWLSAEQMATLFECDRAVISRYISNIYKENELDKFSTCSKIAQVHTEGGREVTKSAVYYNLDVIISVGYRVKSRRGIEFRQWAIGVLKNYIINGCAVNNMRAEESRQTIQLMKKEPDSLDARQVMSVVERYAAALDLLDDYDHQCVAKPKGAPASYILSYKECRRLIDSMKFASESDLFGNEKDDSFKGSIGAIYQSFGGTDIYPSLQEKAANLLYFVVKNHSFSDGNKRIAAALFLYFLDKNNYLFINGRKIIDDSTLVAVTIMIAESKPDEKEIMINLVMNFLKQGF